MGRSKAYDGLFAGLRSALGTGGGEANLAALRRVDDWNAVAGLAQRHRVVSLMLRGLRRAGASCPRTLSALAPLRKRWAARALGQLAGMRAALSCLGERGIPALVLKGQPLGESLFGAPLDRECYDIDLLVPPAAAAEAANTLLRNGWNMRAPVFEPTPARNRYFEKYVKNRIFSGPGGTLELHHRLASNPHLLPAPFEELWERADTVDIGGSSFSVLGGNDLLVYLFVHGQMHRWSRLKWLCDVAAKVDSMKTDEFTAVMAHGRRQGLALGPAFGPALRLCGEAFRMNLPKPAAELASGAAAERAARVTRDLWNRPGGGKGLQGVARRSDEIRNCLAFNPSRRCAAHELARLFASPYDLDRVGLPDRMFFLYPPLRPLLWLSGRMGRDASRRTPRTVNRPAMRNIEHE